MKKATKHPNCQEVQKASYVIDAKFIKVGVRHPSPLSLRKNGRLQNRVVTVLAEPNLDGSLEKWIMFTQRRPLHCQGGEATEMGE